MSQLLLDTHTLLWSLFSPDRLSSSVRDAILDPSNSVLVSVASAWEVAIKQSVGKLKLPDSLEQGIEGAGFRFLSISPEHCTAYADLPLLNDHRDPFDRMLVVQSRMEGCLLASCDQKLDDYSVNRFW